MFAFYVIATNYAPIGSSVLPQRLNLDEGLEWNTFEPGTATIWIHPDIDYHYIRGDLLFRGKEATLMECPPNYRIKEPGVYILAHNHKAAMELIR